MTSANFPADVQSPFFTQLLEPMGELGDLSRRIQTLFDRGLTTDQIPLIHDGGRLLEEFAALGTKHRLFSKMAEEMADISQNIPYKRALKNFGSGVVSSEILMTLFEYVSPSLDQLRTLIRGAQDTVPAALVAMIRNGGILQSDLWELIPEVFDLPDNRALTLLLEFKLHGYLTSTNDDPCFDLPHIISGYFAKSGTPAHLKDAGALGQYLLRELPTLTQRSESAEARDSGQPNLFSLDMLELFAASGFAEQAAKMAAFHLEYDLADDPRRKSRLAALGQEDAVANEVFNTISAMKPWLTDQVNFCLESTRISIAQFTTLLMVSANRVSPGALMTGFGNALSAYDRMSLAQQAQLLEKGALVMDRFVQLLDQLPARMRKEAIEGLGSVLCEYSNLDQAGKAMLKDKTISVMQQCMARLDGQPVEQEKLQRELIAMEHMRKAIWESVEWMTTRTLEIDLGL
jgi:hypothetical protein